MAEIPAQDAIDEAVQESTKAAFFTLVSNLSGGMAYEQACMHFRNAMMTIRDARRAVGDAT